MFECDGDFFRVYVAQVGPVEQAVARVLTSEGFATRPPAHFGIDSLQPVDVAERTVSREGFAECGGLRQLAASGGDLFGQFFMPVARHDVR